MLSKGFKHSALLLFADNPDPETGSAFSIPYLHEEPVVIKAY